MTQVIEIMLTTIAPIILVAGLGAILDRTRLLDARSISRIAIYLTSPALAYYGMANTSMQSNELGRLIVASFAVMAAATALAWLIAKVFGLSRLTTSAFILTVGLINIGNYGIPLNEFAFGQPGLERAIIVAVAGFIYANTVGVVIASAGKASLWQSLKNVAKVPAPYAVALGLAVNFGELPVPFLIDRAATILEGAAVPLMLLMLGLQTSRVSVTGQWPLILGASGLRLLGGCAIGLLLSWALGLEGVTRQVLIVESSMPSAVIAAMLATEFESDARLAGSVILVSTLLSVVMLSLLLVVIN